ncbi:MULTISPECIES: CHAD domain-containing protein [Ensifer]|uniref:CHAD domain-containing protein n=1 Tax=Ensifer TaxID=106591 RepID=UPI000713028C|nr:MULTISPECIES: CHAD domain-containing protein [Ensifer]KQX57611.1 metal-binding protein [Ensifer sp. Root1298]KQX92773.1 metal-binding protein [Ensifer sp. Root1312]KRC28542.1 metal-binding protein [Ensifer sp. Root74]KRD78576.1 metal-binding protein [Ensifer sp. Root954]MBD9652294.1 CHAD domain-containing protein [Ensifer sp. ENS09]
MTYAFEPGRPFSEDFRTIAAEQLTQAVMTLEDRPDGVHEAIHDARKNFKRLRSLYRLVAADVPLFQKHENARIRDMARNLSTVRDAAALVENAHYLKAAACNEEEERALDHVCERLTTRRDRITASATDIEDRVAATIVRCEQALQALSQVTFDDRRRKTADRLTKGWRRTLRRAKRARQACSETSEAPAFHELRKRAQDYRMHLGLMHAVWPSALQAKRTEAKALVDTLGHLNDLAVMTQLINEDPGLAGNSQDQAHLIAAVIDRQGSLRKHALDLAAEVFQEEPDDESRTIRLLWLDAAR